MDELPSMEALLGRHVDMRAVRKIGEGTFGEAFKARRRSICSQWAACYILDTAGCPVQPCPQ